MIGRYYDPWHVKRGTILAYSLLAGNWYLILYGVTGPIIPLWSISLEEQFYLLWPTIFTKLPRKWFAYFSMSLIPVSGLSVWFFFGRNGGDFGPVWWNTFSQIQFFGIGSLLALYDHKLKEDFSSQGRLLLVLAGLIAWLAGGFANAASLGTTHPTVALVTSYWFAAIGCACLFLSSFGAKAIHPFFLYLGKISYGLYVFHVAGMDTAGFFVRRLLLPHSIAWTATFGLLLTFIAARYSFIFLELPALKYKKRFEVIRTR